MSSRGIDNVTGGCGGHHPGERTEAAQSCCAPSAVHEKTAVGLSEAAGASRAIDAASDMVSLPGGTFLMGTDYPHGFPLDGEGPVRPVTLSPFQIDRFPVTNEEFAAFVDATGYRTEAEIFGWSFVFWSHLPAERFEELVEDTVAAAPWWAALSAGFSASARLRSRDLDPLSPPGQLWRH